MRLAEVTVQNYRSITVQTKFAMNDQTILVGPNNEGKTNLLRALALGMELIQRWSTVPSSMVRTGEVQGTNAMMFLRPRRSSRTSRTGQTSIGYRWSDDYPLGKQGRRGSQPTLLRLCFSLDEDEVLAFSEQTGIATNGELPIEITLGKLSAKFGIVKPGRGAMTHRARSQEIAKFIDSRISLVSIPAVRTSEQAIGLANELVRIRTRSLADTDEYQELVTRLNELRSVAEGNIANDLAVSVKSYVPSITRVELLASGVERTNSIDDLIVDDGTSTSIDSKGDGIKSLVTMALIQELAREQSSGHSFVLAVDEPEAHLHPASVHELHSLFNQLSVSQQVVLATHNPIFVNRDRIESNVLVKANTATVAKNVSVLRSALGVQLGDNLQSAETIVLVEGVSDEKILPLLLGEVDSRIETEVSAGRIVFRATKGTGQMRSQIQREKATVCRILCVLDDDAAGKTEAKSIKSHNILPDKNIFLLGNGSRQAEIEDLLLPEVYLASLEQEFGRTFKTAHFANKGRIWTNNLSEAAKTLGIIDSDEDLVDRAKTAVASAVEQAQTVLLRSEKKEHVQALASLILGN